MKKIALLTLFVIMVSIDHTVDAASYGDTEQAVKDCQLFLERSRELTAEESSRAASCLNFVIGAWDMSEYLSWREIFLGNQPPFCPPQEPVDVAMPILVFLTYIEKHPEDMEHRLAMVLEWSFKSAFPCTDGFYSKLGN